MSTSKADRAANRQRLVESGTVPKLVALEHAARRTAMASEKVRKAANLESLAQLQEAMTALNVAFLDLSAHLAPST